MKLPQTCLAHAPHRVPFSCGAAGLTPALVGPASLRAPVFGPHAGLAPSRPASSSTGSSNDLSVGNAATFVSSYFRLEPGAVAAYLDRHGLSYRDTPTHFIVRACPLCGKPHGEKTDNLWKLYVRKADGAFFCHRCGAGGSWYDLKGKLGDLAVSPTPVSALTGSSVAAAVPSGSRAAGDSLGSLAFSQFGSGAASPRDAGPKSRSGGSDAGSRGSSGAVSMDLSPAGILSASSSLLTPVSSFPSVYRYLTEKRGLEPEVLREYAVGAVAKAWPGGGEGAGPDIHECVMFPWLSRTDAGAGGAAPGASPSAALVSAVFGGPGGNSSLSTGAGPDTGFALPLDAAGLSLARVKLRSITDKSKQVLLPKGGGWGLFGLHTVPASATSLVLTEGEFDALSVRQGTGAHAVSLPNGCRSLPVEVLPMLERFGRLYLWLDDDGPGREGADRMAAKLGMGRCYVVRPTAELVIPRVPALPPVSTDAAAPAAAAGDAASAQQQLQLPKDANEALVRGLDLSPLLHSASPRPHDAIVSIAELRPAIMREVAAALGIRTEGDDRRGRGWSAAGVPIRCLPGLQRLLKGHRSGEVTIVTGPTGCGKTTLLAQLSLDLAAQGVPTLWGSFEIKAPRLLATMAAQLRSGRVVVDPAVAAEAGLMLPSPSPPVPATLKAHGAAGAVRPDITLDPETGAMVPTPGTSAAGSSGGDGNITLSDPQAAAAAAVMAQFEQAADALAALPLHVLRFFGSTDVDKVVDALEYAAYAHDVRHVILDNLQFMMSGATGSARGWDRFEVQERALDRFRAFATKHDVHVTLVVHPRKEPEDEPLSLSSVFGSAKATQEADTVIILQRERDKPQQQQGGPGQQGQYGSGGNGGGYSQQRGGQQQQSQPRYGGQQQQQQQHGPGGEPEPEPRKYLDVRKNRYDGSLGKVHLSFDPESKCFYEQGFPAAAAAQGAGSSGHGQYAGGQRRQAPVLGHPQHQQQRQMNSYVSSAASRASHEAATGLAPPKRRPVEITRQYGPVTPAGGNTEATGFAPGAAAANGQAAQPGPPMSPAVDMGLLGAMTQAAPTQPSVPAGTAGLGGNTQRRGYHSASSSNRGEATGTATTSSSSAPAKKATSGFRRPPWYGRRATPAFAPPPPFLAAEIDAELLARLSKSRNRDSVDAAATNGRCGGGPLLVEVPQASPAPPGAAHGPETA